MNNTVISATNCSLYEFLFGFKFYGPVGRFTNFDFSLPQYNVKYLRKYLRYEAQFVIDFTVSEQKRIYDTYYRYKKYETGNKV